LGVEAGDRLELIESEQGLLVVAATRDIRSLMGIVRQPKKPVTTSTPAPKSQVYSAELRTEPSCWIFVVRIDTLPSGVTR
jgi:hypothetical protein